jgi:protein-tyrosine kinase
MTDRPVSAAPYLTEARGAAAAARPGPIAAEAVGSLNLSREELDARGVVGFNSRDSRSRPYHLLRTQLTKIMARNNWRMIGVTSATPGAGKTFTAVNLAAALAPTAEATVLLCDLDLRRGSVGEMLDVGVDAGLADYLDGQVEDPRELALRINDTHLVVLPTAPTASSSSELIASPRFRSLMARLRAMPENTRVICDLPPVFANDDAMLCMQQLDAYLLVVDHGVSTAGQVEECIRLLDPVPCLGTVLNRYRGGFGDPYGYGYGDAYGMKQYGA